MVDEHRANLPLWKKLAYSSGNASGQFLQWAFVSYFVYYFSPTQGVAKTILPMAVTTGIVFYSRFIDGFLEPIVGYWSDNCKSRRGRRIPFLLYGGLPMCLFFFLMWVPPFASGSTAMINWVAGFQILFWFCVTLVFCPYLGLLPEITDSSEERVFISQLMTIFLLVATLAISIVPKFAPIRFGHLGMPIFAAVLGFITIYMPVLFIKEKQHKPHPDEKTYGIIEALQWTLSNRAFVIYIVSSIFLMLGFQTVMNSLMYIVTALLRKPEEFLPVIFLVCMGSVVLSFILIALVQKHFTKKTMYLFSILGLGLLIPLMYFLSEPTILGLPTLPVAYVIFFILGLPMAGMMSMQMPILADIADCDEKQVGYRREAMFFGAQGCIQKYAIATTSLIQGYLFTHYGYSVENPMGVRLLGPVTGCFVLLGFFVFLFYPLDEKTKIIKGKAKTYSLLYFLAAILPIAGPPVGILIGKRYSDSKDEEDRAAGNICMILGALGLALQVGIVIYMFAHHITPLDVFTKLSVPAK